MMISRIGFLLFPIVLIYGLTLLRILARYFARVFGDDREENRVAKPPSIFESIMPPSTELALASVALDLADVVGRWPNCSHGGFFATGGVMVYLVLPIFLLVFHTQLYILALMAEQRLARSEFGTQQRSHALLLSMVLGMLAAMTNAVTIGALITPRGF